MCVVMVVYVCVCSNGCVCVVGWNGGKVYDRSEGQKASLLSVWGGGNCVRWFSYAAPSSVLCSAKAVLWRVAVDK